MSVAHIINSTWNNVVYFPQAPVSIYLLECGEGIGANLAKGSDLVTNNLGSDWTGESYILWVFVSHSVPIAVSTDCGADPSISEDAESPGLLDNIYGLSGQLRC